MKPTIIIFYFSFIFILISFRTYAQISYEHDLGEVEYHDMVAISENVVVLCASINNNLHLLEWDIYNGEVINTHVYENIDIKPLTIRLLKNNQIAVNDLNDIYIFDLDFNLVTNTDNQRYQYFSLLDLPDSTLLCWKVFQKPGDLINYDSQIYNLNYDLDSLDNFFIEDFCAWRRTVNSNGTIAIMGTNTSLNQQEIYYFTFEDGILNHVVIVPDAMYGYEFIMYYSDSTIILTGSTDDGYRVTLFDENLNQHWRYFNTLGGPYYGLGSVKKNIMDSLSYMDISMITMMVIPPLVL